MSDMATDGDMDSMMDMGDNMTDTGSSGGIDPSMDGMDGTGMRQLADMMAPMCPLPTVPIVAGLVTGFGAAVASALAHGGHASGGHGDMHGRYQSMDVSKPSGALFNPAVTVAFALRRLISPLRTCVYLACQLLGGLLGAGLVLGCIGSACLEDALGVPPFHVGGLSSLQPASAAGHTFLGSAILSAVLVLIHLWSSQRMGFMAAPLIVGFTYLAATIMQYPWNQHTSFNPIRHFSLAAVVPHSVMHNVEGHDTAWVVWLSCLTGAIIGFLLDLLLFTTWPCEAADKVHHVVSDAEDALHHHATHHAAKKHTGAGSSNSEGTSADACAAAHQHA